MKRRWKLELQRFIRNGQFDLLGPAGNSMGMHKLSLETVQSSQIFVRSQKEKSIFDKTKEWKNW